MAVEKEEDIKKSADVKILKRLFPYLKKEILVFVICFILIGATTAIDLIVPYITKVAIDESIGNFDNPVIESSDGVEINGQKYKKVDDNDVSRSDRVYYLENIDGDIFLTSDGFSQKISFTQYSLLRLKDKEMLKNLSLLLIGLLILNFIFSFVNVYLLSYGAQKIVYNLRSDLYNHLLKLSLHFFDKNPVGRLVTRVTSDMTNISQLFTDVLITVIKDVFLIAGTIIVMVSLNWRLGLTALATLPFVLIISTIFRVYARRIQRDVKVKLAKINSYLSESINGMKIIQIFNREKLSTKEFDEQNKDHLKSSIDETKIYAFFRPGIHLMSGISLGLIVLVGGLFSIDGSLEIGIVVAFFQYINHLYRPISDLAEKFNIFQSSMASSERVFLLLDEKEDIKDPRRAKTIDRFKGQINLQDVVFSYIPGEPVIKGINLDINPGETIALVGATGSGKTTITSLIGRLYDVDSGSIKIDGVDIRDMNKEDLRSRISVVLQDVFLFAGDIKGNIGLNNNEIGLERIVESAEYVNASRFIEKLPGRYDHEVRERGSTFSAGEKQLVSFARALAFNPDILILDEATSSIDTETEMLIQDAIEKLIKDRTTIIVAHRLSTIKHADKIVVMHKGEIKEVGKHDELLEKGGMYYDLYKLQVEQ